MPTLEEMWGESFWENPDFEESLEFGGEYDTASYADYIGMDYDPADPGAFWSQVGGEQWGGGGFEQGDVPDFLYYEDVEESPYSDFEDILYEVTDGQLGYGDIAPELGVIGTGETETYWDLYMDEFYEFDDASGEYVSRYDAQEFEKPERKQLEIARGTTISQLEGDLGKYRKSQEQGIGGPQLDISDIARIGDESMATHREKYRADVRESEMAWTDDFYSSLSDMAGQLDWEQYDL